MCRNVEADAAAAMVHGLLALMAPFQELRVQSFDVLFGQRRVSTLRDELLETCQ
jgi:hypothetical protein